MTPRDTFDADRSEDPIFIHSTVDDAGLDVFEFRILCHLKRRANAKMGGRAYPGAESMAKTCKMSETKVREAVKGLERRKMLYVHRSTGGRQSNHYYLTAAKDWNLTGAPHDPLATRTAPVRHTNRTGAPDDGEGNPIGESIEGNPSCELPLEGESTKKDQALSIYEHYPRKTAKQAGITAIMKALKKCPFEKLLQATKNYAASVAGHDQQYLPYPATFYNQGRYNEYHEPHEQHDTDRNRTAARALW